MARESQTTPPASRRAVAGATVVAEERGYLDAILALSISRGALMIAACVVAAAVSLAIMILVGAMTFLAGRIAGTDISGRLVAAGAIGVWPLAVFFGGVTAVACGHLHRSRLATGIALGAFVGMYAIDLAGSLLMILGAVLLERRDILH